MDIEPNSATSNDEHKKRQDDESQKLTTTPTAFAIANHESKMEVEPAPALAPAPEPAATSAAPAPAASASSLSLSSFSTSSSSSCSSSSSASASVPALSPHLNSSSPFMALQQPAPVSVSFSAPAPAPSPSSSPSSLAVPVQQAQSQSQSLDDVLSQYLPFTDLPLVKLHHTSQQRAQYDQLADVFALLTSIEHLEHAYVRDAITANEYTATCNKMLAQMKTLREALLNDLPDLNRFVHDFSLTVPAAMKRIEAGVPATVLHGDIGKADSGGKELAVFHGVQHFITAMDSLKLGLKAVDELYPHLSDLMDAINKVGDLPNDHEAKTKVRQWLTTLASMRAHEEISADQQRQMAFDLDTAYSSFHKFVKQGRKE